MDNSKEIREAFAAAALVGLLASDDNLLAWDDGPAASSARLLGVDPANNFARIAFDLADAMLAESKRRADAMLAESKRRADAALKVSIDKANGATP